MLSNPRRDELGRHALEVDAELAHSAVTAQVASVYAAERAQEVAHGCPHPFDSVGIRFANTIAVVACSFLLAVTHGGMGVQDVIVALPFIGVDPCADSRKPMDMIAERLIVRVMHDAQSNLARVAPHRAHHGRPVIVIGVLPQPMRDNSMSTEWGASDCSAVGGNWCRIGASGTRRSDRDAPAPDASRTTRGARTCRASDDLPVCALRGATLSPASTCQQASAGYCV